METFDKYETKRTGLTLDEALEAAVCGYRVRRDTMIEGSYIHYEFNGFRIQFADIRGRIGEGSSSGWTPTDVDSEGAWAIFDPKPAAVDKWGLPKQAAPAIGKWGPGNVK